jgi:hypothetical protein
MESPPLKRCGKEGVDSTACSAPYRGLLHPILVFNVSQGRISAFKLRRSAIHHNPCIRLTMVLADHHGANGICARPSKCRGGNATPNQQLISQRDAFGGNLVAFSSPERGWNGAAS